MQMVQLSQKYIFNFYVMFDGGIAQWLSRRRETSTNIEIIVPYKMQLAQLSQKDIFNFYVMFDGGVAQRLTRCREA